MTQDKLPIGGAVVFWRMARQTHRQEVRDGLARLGLAEYAPEPRAPLACLKDALAQVYSEKQTRQVIRPIKNGKTKGFAVVVEKPDEVAHAGDAWGEVRAAAILGEEDGKLSLDPPDYDKRIAIQDAMAQAAQWVGASACGAALVKLAEDYCDGVSLKPNGGVYWVREDRLDEWACIAEVFEKAHTDNQDKPNAVYVMRVVADEQMAHAVGDALTAEIEAELASIEADISEGNLQEQACINRLRKTGSLEAKVKRYEAAFDASLAQLRQAIDRAAVAVAQAAVQSAAGAIA
jgi:hypothetical protein